MVVGRTILVGPAAAVPKESFRLYDSTYLLYTDGWNEIDRLSAYLVNAKMRDMCKKEDSTSLIFDAVSDDLVSMFNDTFFVVGMTHVQSQETITVSTSGHRATDTERHGTSGLFAQSARAFRIGGGSSSRTSRGGGIGRQRIR